MAIASWTRRNRNELSTLRSHMDDLFEGFFRGLDRPLSFLTERAWPTVDVAETDDAILVRAEVPRCKPEDIDISVYDNTLTLSGEKKESRESGGDGYYHMESTYGSFRRDIPLSAEVDQDKIEAVVKDGILSVTLPKAEKSKAVKVKVKG
jgi:HSP20 family protein